MTALIRLNLVAFAACAAFVIALALVPVAAAQDPEPAPAAAAAEPAAATPAIPTTSRPAGPARAVAAKPISAALLIGFGTDLGKDFNPWGFGFGLRGGYNIGRIYVGGHFAYHFGSSAEFISPGLSIVEVDYNLWDLSAEAGYDFPFSDKLTVRPSLLLGVSRLGASSDSVVFGGDVAVSAGSTKLQIAPGATILYDINEDIFLGGDARIPWVVGGGSIFGFVLYATAGLHI
jgi:hypothetical protein